MRPYWQTIWSNRTLRLSEIRKARVDNRKQVPERVKGLTEWTNPARELRGDKFLACGLYGEGDPRTPIHGAPLVKLDEHPTICIFKAKNSPCKYQNPLPNLSRNEPPTLSLCLRALKSSSRYEPLTPPICNPPSINQLTIPNLNHFAYPTSPQTTSPRDQTRVTGDQSTNIERTAHWKRLTKWKAIDKFQWKQNWIRVIWGNCKYSETLTVRSLTR